MIKISETWKVMMATEVPLNTSLHPYLELREAASIAGVCLTPSLRAGREDSSWQLPLKEPGMLYNDSIYKSSQSSVCCFSKDTCSNFPQEVGVSRKFTTTSHVYLKGVCKSILLNLFPVVFLRCDMEECKTNVQCKGCKDISRTTWSLKIIYTQR